eukprot:1160816-Pelagomonas_calceolata.AAC.4
MAGLTGAQASLKEAERQVGGSMVWPAALITSAGTQKPGVQEKSNPKLSTWALSQTRTRESFYCRPSAHSLMVCLTLCIRAHQKHRHAALMLSAWLCCMVVPPNPAPGTDGGPFQFRSWNRPRAHLPANLKQQSRSRCDLYLKYLPMTCCTNDQRCDLYLKYLPMTCCTNDQRCDLYLKYLPTTCCTNDQRCDLYLKYLPMTCCKNDQEGASAA